MTRSHSSSGCSAAGARSIVPALLTRMSTCRCAQLVAEGDDGVAVGEVDGAGLERAAVRRRRRASMALPVGSIVALTPMMSAPAAARRLGHGEADAALGARDDRRGAGEVEADAHATASCPACTSTRIFIARPASRSSKAARVSASGTIAVMSSVGGDGAVGDELDRALEVGALVDARAEDAQLPPEHALQVDLARRRGGWRRRRACRAPSRGRWRRGRPRRRPETSKTTSAPAPPVHSSTQATWSTSRGSSVSNPRLVDLRPPARGRARSRRPRRRTRARRWR